MTTEQGKPTTVLPERKRPGLFEAFGVEIEYMIVDRDGLDVAPICDRLIETVAGRPASEIELDDIAWSNELTLHVLELKTNGPAPSLAGLAARFQEHVGRADDALAGLGARLLPGAMHPWMDPAVETRLWPHEYTDAYQTFDRIFGCSGHGWANLQSTHLNLPFADDEEFARLHAAVRIVLPLIPAISAASPFQDGARGPALDGRLIAYRGNARRVPSVTGRVVPEAVFDRAQYEREILGRIYDDLAPHDPEGVLRHEWANARGAIARFDRGAVEIRVVDAQECPASDLAVMGAVTTLVRNLAVGRLANRDLRADPTTDELADLFDRVVVEAERAVIDHPAVLAALGLPDTPVTAREVWFRLLEATPPTDADLDAPASAALHVILARGPLARRMLAVTGESPDRPALARLAASLAEHLRVGRPFLGER